jgi:hypothetical protein
MHLVNFLDGAINTRQNRGRAVTHVIDHAMWIDTQVAIDGSENIGVGNGIILRFGGGTVRTANDLTGTHATTRQQGTVDSGPMVSSSVLIDLGCPAELGRDTNGHILVQTAGVNIFDQCGNAAVEQRQMLLEIAEIPPRAYPRNHTPQ